MIPAPEPTGLQRRLPRVRRAGPRRRRRAAARRSSAWSSLVIVFSALRPETFTNSFNFANLLIQSAPVIVIAMGLVFVLLIGEIDLSAGFTAGVAGAVLGVVSTRHD